MAEAALPRGAVVVAYDGPHGQLAQPCAEPGRVGRGLLVGEVGAAVGLQERDRVASAVVPLDLAQDRVADQQLLDECAAALEELDQAADVVRAGDDQDDDRVAVLFVVDRKSVV